MKVIALLCMVGLCVSLLFSGNAMAKTLFFDDFEAGADKWPAMPTLSIEEDPDRPGNSMMSPILQAASESDSGHPKRYTMMWKYMMLEDLTWQLSLAAN